MTAFAQADSVTESFTVTCSLRSVNHRYCDLSLKLPDCLKTLECTIRQRIQKQLARGKIECVFTLIPVATDRQTLAVDHNYISRLLTQLQMIERELTHPGAISAIDIVKFPGVLSEPTPESDLLAPAVDNALNLALKQLIGARQREGEKLAELIRERCRLLMEQTGQARTMVADVKAKLRAKLEQNLTAMSITPDRDRLEQELVFYAQRLDISEELDRLESHAEEVLFLLTRDGACGRKLDFLMQEMNREANTLGSKSSDIELTRVSVDSKVLIEQMREQIQNIE